MKEEPHSPDRALIGLKLPVRRREGARARGNAPHAPRGPYLHQHPIPPRLIASWTPKLWEDMLELERRNAPDGRAEVARMLLARRCIPLQ